MFKKNLLLDGNYICKNYYEIIQSKIFKKLLSDFIKINKDDENIAIVLNNLSSNKIEQLKILFALLSQFPVINKKIFIQNKFEFIFKNQYSMKYFTTKLYDFWRSHNRFLIKQEKFICKTDYRVMQKQLLCENNKTIKLNILSLFRQVLQNIVFDTNKVYRQTTASAECSLLVDYSENPFNDLYTTFKKTLYTWFVSIEPPVIYYTKQNKRKGIIKTTNKNILNKSKINGKDFIAFPLWVGTYFIHAYVHKDFMHLGTSLTNLMELCDFEKIDKKPDGIVVFGMEEKLFEGNTSGLVFQDKTLNIPIGCVPYTDKVDYFGYMKKMILTIHNIITIHNNRLPVHGSFAKITLKNNKSFNVMLIGDSGAGKSETLEALNTIKSKIKHMKIYIDDMGSIHTTNKKCNAYGTEIGAFVRLDDLDPGYAYNTMDRSIFINPHMQNARVIVPFADYYSISNPHKIDLILYANNHEKSNDKKDIVKIYKKAIDSYNVFYEGKRLAKGTTNEIGLTKSYFANPFGAIQLKEKHEKIARKHFNLFDKLKVKVGEIKTQLGFPEKSKSGPKAAAEALITYLENI